MTGNEDLRGGHFIGDSGNIISGTFTGSQATNVSGSQNTATVRVTGTSAARDPWLERLTEELARIRRRLEEDCSSSVATVDRDDAIESVIAAEGEVAHRQDGSQAEGRSMRLRIKGLIGILAPVAEIIGGVAALEAICQHL
jgi:hypothetical protein